MRKLAGIIVVAASWAAIAGCGTKGPLYIPGVPASAPWPYPTPTSTTQEEPEKKPADVPGTSEQRR